MSVLEGARYDELMLEDVVHALSELLAELKPSESWKAGVPLQRYEKYVQKTYSREPLKHDDEWPCITVMHERAFRSAEAPMEVNLQNAYAFVVRSWYPVYYTGGDDDGLIEAQDLSLGAMSAWLEGLWESPDLGGEVVLAQDVDSTGRAVTETGMNLYGYETAVQVQLF